ncbi:MAG TPA: diacylglycerol kinase [Coriobacteriia bacterium]|nr:diacylglycerol kinase [Coriobacteriia bacterium]
MQDTHDDKSSDNTPVLPSDTHRSSIFKAFGYAIEGLFYTIRTQRNMKVHLVVGTFAVIACAALQLRAVEWAIILVLIGLVLMTEMLNTAIEAIIDLSSPEYHRLAKIAKDVGAGMVLVFSILAVAAGLIIYVSAFLRLIG